MIRSVYYAMDDLYQRWIYERPNGTFRRLLVRKALRSDFEEKALRLCRDGILLLPGYFQGEILRTMQEEFNRWAPQAAPDSIGRMNLTEAKGVHLRDSRVFSAAAVDPFVLSLASYYWGKPVTLTQSYGFRLDPNPGGKKVGPFQWHHDANRKQVKIYVLLSDVSPEGQRMDYIPGTNVLWHRFKRGNAGYTETRIPDEVVLGYGRPVSCAGPAGTVLIFDTNGIHAGNQNLSARRDAWVYQYTAGRHIEPLSGLHPEVYGALTPFQRSILRARNLAPLERAPAEVFAR